ncbi:MAG: lysylphosphatidylglycerol synthase domain-containing protein, partial [Oscillospiraceae bacterium]|nr:lysylphosphatidylglycerol synthase domain-containing protein [Oscillospiraceae bacterium]
MKNKKIKKIISSSVRIMFLILVIYFLGKYFVENWEEIKNMNWNLNWFSIIISFLLYFGYMITLASLWHFITKLNQCSIKHFDAVIAYLSSIPGKYIPGKVFLLMARCPAYEKANQPLRKVTVCFFLENICTLLGASFLFLISLFFFPNDLLAKYM